MKRPELRKIPLDPTLLHKPGVLMMTMSVGHLLLELDDNEELVAMYQKDLGPPAKA